MITHWSWRDGYSGAAKGGGQWGRFAPGGKIEVILQNLARGKAFLGGDILGTGYKRVVDGRKIEKLQKNFGV